LWEFRTASGVNGVPVSFQLDGKQYIAVQSGWGVDAARMQARLNLARPWEYPDVPQGGAVWVFALEQADLSLRPPDGRPWRSVPGGSNLGPVKTRWREICLVAFGSSQ